MTAAVVRMHPEGLGLDAARGLPLHAGDAGVSMHNLQRLNPIMIIDHDSVPDVSGCGLSYSAGAAWRRARAYRTCTSSERGPMYMSRARRRAPSIRIRKL